VKCLQDEEEKAVLLSLLNDLLGEFYLLVAVFGLESVMVLAAILCGVLAQAPTLQIYSTRLETLCPLYVLSLLRSNNFGVGVPI
jgi:uncharacterized membrane protein YqjE